MEREIVHVARVAGRIGPRAVRARTGSLRAARSPADACAAPSSAAAWAFAGPAACPRGASPRLASRLTFRAVQPSSGWTWDQPVPRHRARPMPYMWVVLLCEGSDVEIRSVVTAQQCQTVPNARSPRRQADGDARRGSRAGGTRVPCPFTNRCLGLHASVTPGAG